MTAEGIPSKNVTQVTTVTDFLRVHPKSMRFLAEISIPDIREVRAAKAIARKNMGAISQPNGILIKSSVR